MDTLADLASMQSHQPARPNSFKANSHESIKSVDSVSHIVLTQSSLTSNPRASFDINMLDTAKDTRRTDFTNTSLAPDEQARLSDLANYLVENPSAYESHVAAINLLHRAFIEFVYPTSHSGEHLPKRSPSSFDLFQDLRSARKEMEKLFAIGEALWLDWLQDESMTASTTEERIDVIENFRKAVTDEPSSSRIWAAYGDWVSECYRWANETASSGDIDEDRLVGREVFSWQMVLETWQDAVDSTRNDLASSHLVWNKYMNVKMSEFQSGISKEQATELLALFEQRLRTPHVALDTTKQLLSTFMNAHFSQDQYFDIMGDTGRIMKDALRVVEERAVYETKLEEAQSKGDQNLEYKTFAEYIEWERTPSKRKRVDFDRVHALYQRAELKYPSDTALWEDHAAFVLESGKPGLDVLSGATKHCPWSGSLWAQHLLESDRQGCSYEDTEGIKHKATSTGVLEAAGIEEVLKVYSAWCSYLRRRARRPDRDEDDADIAEIGIRTSIENISNLGAKSGVGEAPDPSFRLQRIYINFLSESGRWDFARREFDRAVRDYGHSWQFWLCFYQWEMMRWRTFAVKSAANEPLTAMAVPRLATAVLKSALEQDDLDYPEPILEALAGHCEDFEDADEMQICQLKARRYEKQLAARRYLEAAQQKQNRASEDARPVRPSMVKRKREFNESDETLYEHFKKSKTDEDAIETVEQAPPENLKRDREHATILVEGLPEHVAESKVRRYFGNCGTVKTLKMLDNGSSAIVEFDDDQAARYALSRDGQQFEDAIITVVLDTGSTVFLTNYSPTADEKEMRALLEPYGEIISIRFPSLQGNKRRRFCYVQFKLPGEAQSAVNELDGKEINGLNLVCKISNPSERKTRQETSVNDGRTVFIGGLSFKASEEEVREAFARHGKISLIRMPLHETMKNRNKGIAFVTYESGEEAQAALQMSGKRLKDREIKVEIATDRGESKRHHPTSGRVDVAGTENHAPSADSHDRLEQRSERTIFLTNIPDTVNEARLRRLAAEYGEVVKCILKTNHQGAVVEYASVSQAGEAALALDGQQIADGRIRVVSEQEMKRQGPEKKVERNSAPKKTTGTPMPSSGFVRRPVQATNNKSRKGGNLGRKSAFAGREHTGTSNGQGVEGHEDKEAAHGAVVQKSNDDFRALVMGGKAGQDA